MKNISEKIKTLVSSKKFMTIISFVGLYLLVAGTTLAIFTAIRKPSTYTPAGSEEKRSKINLDLPKTEVCPINGAKFTKAEKDIWMGRRPITAMIENHIDSRPQSGLSKADVVYEAVAEGGITRFLVVYYCGASAEDVRIGPIRSVRVYYITFASEYATPLFVHSGGANNICSNCPGGVKEKGQVAPEVDAFKMLTDIGWRFAKGNSMDAGTNIGFPIVWRDYERIPGAATEHTFMGSTDKLFTEGVARGFGYKNEKGVAWDKNFVLWKFIDDKAGTGTVNDISFSFWNNKKDYDVEWKYDLAGNKYLRFTGGKAHIDMDTNEQLSAKNIVIQFTKEKGPVDKEGHMFYTTTGEGESLIFQNGTVIKGTWEKASKEARTKYFDDKGKEVSFVRGQTWIEIVPADNQIKY